MVVRGWFADGFIDFSRTLATAVETRSTFGRCGQHQRRIFSSSSRIRTAHEVLHGGDLYRPGGSSDRMAFHCRTGHGWLAVACGVVEVLPISRV